MSEPSHKEMTPERWQQVERLWQAALERPHAERAAFLAQACDGDAALRGEVESLLGFQQQVGDFLEAPPAELAAELLATPRDSWLGRTFSHYQIERQLGQGGMGVVYLARDLQLGRPVALKLLQPRFTQDPERVRRFQQEARAASSLNHPNILTIYEVGQAGAVVSDVHFIAAEFVAGETLRARLEGGPSLAEALDGARQIAAALAAAHEAGIVHRDIKPENVMVRPDGLVKVLDFGLAKLSRSNSDPYQTANRLSGAETRPGVVLGTVNYMSPEQARGERVDARSDIFALGVVLYELAAGRRPFTGPTYNHVLVAIQEQAPPPLPPAAAALQPVVDRMLAKLPAERYQTAAALRDELKILQQEWETAGKPKQPGAESVPPPRRRETGVTAEVIARTTTRHRVLAGFIERRGRALLLLAVTLALIGGWIWLATRRSASRDGAINSIAVLPFANAGSDAQMDYLPDGITEGVIQSLSQLPGLRVMARSTVFTYKGREVDPRQVGATLNVRAVVTGSVLRQGERLIIRAELVDAADGGRLWGDEYQRATADLLALQEEIAREISEKLRLRLSGAAQPAKRQTTDSEAYQLYLKGQYFYYQFTREGMEKALAHFRQAIARDPRYALAYAGIADVYAESSGQYLPPGEAMPQAKQAALTAIALDEALPEAHLSLALAKWWGDWNWAEAERELRRAIGLNPNFVNARAYYADFLARQKRFAEALHEARRAEETDPLSAHVGNMICNVFYYSGQYERLIEQARKTIEFNPSGAWVSWAYGYQGRAFSRLQRHQEALASLQQAVALSRHDVNLSWLGYGYVAAGRRAEAMKLLRELEAEAVRRRVSPTYIARIYLGLGDNDRALAWLRKGYDEHSDHLLNLGVEPIYDPLRADPRFVEMLRGIGLTP
jgi:eukaryotic-like serine/threonine-protein kinase